MDYISGTDAQMYWQQNATSSSSTQRFPTTPSLFSSNVAYHAASPTIPSNFQAKSSSPLPFFRSKVSAKRRGIRSEFPYLPHSSL